MNSKNRREPTPEKMAEREGFEPSVPFWGTHDFQSCRDSSHRANKRISAQ
jgi:hypothetical protein